MSLRALLVHGALGLTVALGAACGADGDDQSATSTTAVTGESPAPPDETCADRAIALQPLALSAELVDPVDFVEGDSADGAAGHPHTGPLVEEGTAHLHYCLGIANGYDDAVAISAIQVLAGESEEPLAIVESDSLTAAFGDGREGERIAASDSVVLEILVPSPSAVEMLHQRIAYTVDDPAGPRDLFLDVTLPAGG
jgi:hypothetical protein